MLFKHPCAQINSRKRNIITYRVVREANNYIWILFYELGNCGEVKIFFGGWILTNAVQHNQRRALARNVLNHFLKLGKAHHTTRNYYGLARADHVIESDVIL